jgi:2-polyprenyl-3-methyl-5-hydroxy-6-metoxy-1,4-benzoquinol methylase
MLEHAIVQRWRHPALLLFILGGVLGALLNFGTTLLFSGLLISKFLVNPSVAPLVAFFVGTLLNQAFHYVYYNVVYVNKEVQMRTSFPIHLFLSFWVSAGSAGLLWLFLQNGMSLIAGLLACLTILALSNALLNRIATFSSAKIAEVEYKEMNESYYEDHTNEKKVSKFRAWYHRSRYERLTKFVMEHFKIGMKMADLGCGNCLWNIHRLPILGIDINEKMLKWAQSHERLKDYKVCADLAETGLESKSLDLVLMSEVLEHVFDQSEVLKEVSRVLKDDGIFLITVPYDFFMGPFFIVFNSNCLYMGYVRGSIYHKYRCGHIHHFTKSRLKKALIMNDFVLDKVFVVNGLLLYASARKKI